MTQRQGKWRSCVAGQNPVGSLCYRRSFININCLFRFCSPHQWAIFNNAWSIPQKWELGITIPLGQNEKELVSLEQIPYIQNSIVIDSFKKSQNIRSQNHDSWGIRIDPALAHNLPTAGPPPAGRATMPRPSVTAVHSTHGEHVRTRKPAAFPSDEGRKYHHHAKRTTDAYGLRNFSLHQTKHQSIPPPVQKTSSSALRCPHTPYAIANTKRHSCFLYSASSFVVRSTRVILGVVCSEFGILQWFGRQVYLWNPGMYVQLAKPQKIVNEARLPILFTPIELSPCRKKSPPQRVKDTVQDRPSCLKVVNMSGPSNWVL